MRRNLAEPALVALADAGLVDAIEVINAKTSLASLNRRAAEFAADRGIAAGAGSDAHVPLALGAAYVEMPDFDGPADFLAKLAVARPVGHHWDQARPWSARVLPEHHRRLIRRPSPSGPSQGEHGGLRAGRSRDRTRILREHGDGDHPVDGRHHDAVGCDEPPVGVDRHVIADRRGQRAPGRWSSRRPANRAARGRADRRRRRPASPPRRG